MRAWCGIILVAVLAAVPVGAAQERRSPSPAGGSAASASVEALLQVPDVQTELKLNSRQIEKINSILRAVREKHQADFDHVRGMSGEERHRQEAILTKAVSEETMKALRDVLEPGQARRVEQIHLQRQGLRAFGDPKVEKALRLTDDQKARIQLITEEAAKEARLLFSPRAQNTFPQALKKVEEVRRIALEKAVALLTDEQKKVWRELIGDPFQVKSGPPAIRPPDKP